MKVTFGGKTVDVPVSELKNGLQVLVVSATAEELAEYVQVEQELVDALKAHLRTMSWEE